MWQSLNNVKLTRRNVVARFYLNAMNELDLIDGLENHEALSNCSNPNLLQRFNVELSKNIACDMVFCNRATLGTLQERS